MQGPGRRQGRTASGSRRSTSPNGRFVPWDKSASRPPQSANRVAAMARRTGPGPRRWQAHPGLLSEVVTSNAAGDCSVRSSQGVLTSSGNSVAFVKTPANCSNRSAPLRSPRASRRKAAASRSSDCARWVNVLARSVSVLSRAAAVASSACATSSFCGESLTVLCLGFEFLLQLSDLVLGLIFCCTVPQRPFVSRRRLCPSQSCLFLLLLANCSASDRSLSAACWR